MHLQLSTSHLEVEIYIDRVHTAIDGGIKWRGDWRCFEWSPMVDCPTECWRYSDPYDWRCPVCCGEQIVYPFAALSFKVKRRLSVLWTPMGLWINGPASDYAAELMNAAIEHDMKRG
jgi:hypothetical protein